MTCLSATWEPSAPRKGALTGAWTCPHCELALPAPRTASGQGLLFQPPRLWHLRWPPELTRTRDARVTPPGLPAGVFSEAGDVALTGGECWTQAPQAETPPWDTQVTWPPPAPVTLPQPTGASCPCLLPLWCGRAVAWHSTRVTPVAENVAPGRRATGDVSLGAAAPMRPRPSGRSLLRGSGGCSAGWGPGTLWHPEDPPC